MRKLLALILAMVMCLTLFAACSTEPAAEQTTEEGATQETPADTTEEVTLKWVLWDIDKTPYYQPLIDGFEAKYPNVKIEMIDLGSTDFTTVLTTQLSGGADDLDIISIKDTPSYSNLTNLGMLEPLNDLNTTDPSLFGGIIEQVTLADGNYYQMPFRSDSWIMYYNKDLFDAANVEYPTNDMTLTEYEALAREMTSGEGAEKIYGAHFHIWRSCVQLFGILDGENTIVDGTYDFLAPYYEMVLGMQQDGIIQDYATLKTSQTHYTGVWFNSQIATMTMGTWTFPTMISKVETGENLTTNWGMVKYPVPEGVEPGTTLGTIAGLGINSKSQYKDLAADFVNFVCGEEGAAIMASVGSIPAITSDEVLDTIASMEGFPTDENSKEALKVTQKYLEMPVSDLASDIDTVLNAGHDNIMTENVTIEEGIAEMNEGVQAILNQ